ncbi:MAG: hypothetical protein JXR63_12615 [Spirochaetales bacterium]|nr:hypothetical protein [Spirochaetales bacterium]
MSTFQVLMLFCGIFWTATYMLIIYQGFKDKSYGMPIAALCANISWEFIFAFTPPIYEHSTMQRIINVLWFAFDLVIIYQLLRYGSKEFKNLPKTIFYGGFGLGLGLAFATVFLLSVQMNDGDGAYAAFGQNMMMSILFIPFLYRRGGLKGQSIWIALTKMIGTVFSTIAFWLYVGSPNSLLNYSVSEFSQIDPAILNPELLNVPFSEFLQTTANLKDSVLMPVFYVGTTIFDIAYVVLVILVMKGVLNFGDKVEQGEVITSGADVKEKERVKEAELV